MKALGDYLRQAREAAGISLQEIQEKTKIRQFYLEAIENGNFDAIPGEVYQKGFLRNYAAAVGLDEKDVIARYQEIKGTKNEPVAVEEQPAVKPEAASVKAEVSPIATVAAASSIRPSKTLSLKKIIPTVVVAGLIMGVVGGWFLVRHLTAKTGTETAVSAYVKPITHHKPARHKSTFKKATPSLRLRANADVWIRLTEKETGNLIEEVTLHNGDTREWKLDRPVVLLNGNAGGLEISVLGGPFKVAGTDGQVLHTTYTPQGEEKIESQENKETKEN